MKTRIKIREILLMLAIALAATSLQGQGFNAGGSPSSSKSSSESKSKSKPKPKPKAKEPVRPSHDEFGIGFNLGWEATYGNSATFHWYPRKDWDVNGGLGYNRSGLKLGAGSAFLWYLTRSFGLRSGLALVYSSGSSGEIELDAYFTPEGSTTREEISASKTYEVDSALLLGTLVGGFYELSSSTQIYFEGTYNAVLAGNQVHFDEDMQFSRNVEASNELHFEKEFEEEAEDKAAAGGLGFATGMRFLF